MSDIDYERQIREGKQIVTDYIQKERPDYAKRINGMNWVQNTEDWKADIHRLLLFVGDQRYLTPFLETELADAPGTPGGDRLLKKKIDKFFAELQENA